MRLGDDGNGVICRQQAASHCEKKIAAARLTEILNQIFQNLGTSQARSLDPCHDRVTHRVPCVAHDFGQRVAILTDPGVAVQVRSSLSTPLPSLVRLLVLRPETP